MRRYESQDRVEVDFDVAALGENVRAKAERRLWGKWLGLRTQELKSIGVPLKMQPRECMDRTLASKLRVLVVRVPYIFPVS